MKNTFVVLWEPGPAWVQGKTVREQPYWDGHAAFMDALFDKGMVVLGGPFADGTGSMVIWESESEQELADLLARDPYVIHGIFALKSLKQWTLFLDARRKG
jgi:uncharacterized protein